MTDREKAKQRTQMLKELREVHKDTVASTQARLKKQKKIYRDINKVIKDGSKTVPEIAEAVGLETHVVLWNLTVLKKYGDVSEAGMSGEYFLYGLTEEKK
ncbi:MAG: transcriptional regulator [Chloroflexota bacterium]|nr:transcriptional regulator [Chloroflexota bacterium]